MNSNYKYSMEVLWSGTSGFSGGPKLSRLLGYIGRDPGLPGATLPNEAIGQFFVEGRGPDKLGVESWSADEPFTGKFRDIEVRRVIVQLADEVKAVKQKCDAKETDNKKLRQLVTDLQAAVKDREAGVERMREAVLDGVAVKELKAQLADVREMHARLIKDKSDEIEKQKIQIESGETKIRLLNDKCNELTGQRDNLNYERGDFQRIVLAKDARIIELSEELQRVVRAKEATIVELREERDRIANVHGKALLENAKLEERIRGEHHVLCEERLQRSRDGHHRSNELLEQATLALRLKEKQLDDALKCQHRLEDDCVKLRDDFLMARDEKDRQRKRADRLEKEGQDARGETRDAAAKSAAVEFKLREELARLEMIVAGYRCSAVLDENIAAAVAAERAANHAREVKAQESGLRLSGQEVRSLSPVISHANSLLQGGLVWGLAHETVQKTALGKLTKTMFDAVHAGDALLILRSAK